jgi:hypothetical protein
MIFKGVRQYSQMPRVSRRKASVKLRRGSVDMHKFSMRQAEIKNLLIPRVEE